MKSEPRIIKLLFSRMHVCWTGYVSQSLFSENFEVIPTCNLGIK